MHLPKAVCDEGGAAMTAVTAAAAAAVRRRCGGAHYIAWRTLVPVLARRAGGQIFPTPLTALIAPGSRPDRDALLQPRRDNRGPDSTSDRWR